MQVRKFYDKNIDSLIFNHLNYLSNKNFKQLDEWIKFKQKINKNNFFWGSFHISQFLSVIRQNEHFYKFTGFTDK